MKTLVTMAVPETSQVDQGVQKTVDIDAAVEVAVDRRLARPQATDAVETTADGEAEALHPIRIIRDLAANIIHPGNGSNLTSLTAGPVTRRSYAHLRTAQSTITGVPPTGWHIYSGHYLAPLPSCYGQKMIRMKD